MDTQTQVLGVEGRSTRYGVFYDVTAADGIQYSTKKGDLAAKAQGLVGQTVDLRFTHKTKTKDGNTYDNYYLEDIALAGQLSPAALPGPNGVAVVTPTSIPIAGAPTSPPAPVPMVKYGSEPRDDPARQQNIVKQVAFKVAGTVTASLFEGAGPEAAGQAGDVLDGLAQRIFERFYGSQTPAQPAPTAEAVAAAVNAEASADVVQVGAAVPTW